MFENLLESKVRQKRSWGQAVVSLVVHGAVIFGAVKATQGVAETIREHAVDTTLFFVPPPEPTQPTPQPASPPPSDAVVSVNPPPKGFKVLAAPTEIPTEILPPDPNEEPFDPKEYTGIGIEGGSANGVIGGTGPTDVGGGGRGGGVYAVGDLDDPVQLLSIPTPRYPPALQRMRITGLVDLQYVVDTTGHAEPNSFKILHQTDPAFVPPAKEAILKGVFKPAKFRGRPVRQLVQQRISFRDGQ